jgi:hypothetical protein
MHVRASGQSEYELRQTELDDFSDKHMFMMSLVPASVTAVSTIRKNPRLQTHNVRVIQGDDEETQS